MEKNKINNLPPKIRVIFVIPGVREGMGMIFSKNEADFLRSKDVDVEEFYLSSRRRPLIILKELNQLLYKIKEFNPHIIHAQFGGITAFIAAVASLLTRTPLVINFRGSDLNNTSKADGFLVDIFTSFFSQVSVLQASGVICVSTNLLKKVWLKKKNMRVIPSAIDLDFFYPVPKEEARIRLKWDPNEKVVLFNANNYGLKRLDLALLSVNRAKRVIPSIRLEVLKGDTPYSLMPLYLNASDCLLMCSDSEGSPTIVREALACNLPVVSTDIGDVAEQIKDVYPSKISDRDENKLSESIINVISINCRSNGREVLQQRGISKDLLMRELIDLYRSVLIKAR